MTNETVRLKTNETYFDEKKDNRMFESEEELLVQKIQAGDLEARNKLIECNLKYVRYIVNDIIKNRRNEKLKFAFDDFVQAGCVGIIHAAMNYNPSHQTKFTTYATSWIRGEILKEMEFQLTSIKYSEEDKKYRKNYIAEISMEESVVPNEDIALLDILEDEQLTPLERVIWEEEQYEMAGYIDTLSEEEKVVLQLLYEKHQNYRKIAKDLDISEFDVKDIEENAINKLKELYKKHDKD